MSQPMAATISKSSATYSFLLRLALAAAIVLLFASLSRAGGPKYIAGTSYFDPSVTGQPLTWPLGQVTYYTDQGDLSPILPSSSADSFVADAFSQWTTVSTAALTATNAGHLAEDVNRTNVIRNSDGTLTIPADIQPSATGTSGAGNASQCFWNATFGGADNFSALASFQHALVVINGQCAQKSSQLTDVEYRLVRTLGGVLGLGWSQVNINVVTGHPPAPTDDLAGFPVMHFADLFSCVPITLCYPNPYQLVMDDQAAVSRLYPVTAQNQSSFPGKQVFSATTARLHGSVWFADPSGNPTQPMQGVNVVARWIDSTTGLPSRRYATSSVSGFLFTGNTGNPITGFSDPLGNAYSRFGSADPAVEGFFDLAGLQLPNNATSALYQLSVEPLDPLWSGGIGPYAPFQVAPSGAPQPIVVTLTPGVDLQQDIVLTGSAQPVPQWAAAETWSRPAAVPAAGDWIGSLSGYGDVAYFSLPAQLNRTLSISVTGLDEGSQASEGKTQPVIGMWDIADPQGMLPPALPLTARVVSNGKPQSGTTVNFTIVSGSGSLSSSSATTNSSGYATVTLTLTKFLAPVQVSACVAPANSPCQVVYGNVVPTSLQNLQPVAGSGQVTTSRQPLQPVTVRVVDSSSPPNPVLGATVAFQVTVMRPSGDAPAGGSGESTSGNPATPIILSMTQSSVQTDVNGLATLLPSTGPFTGTLETDVLATSGSNAALKYVLEALPASTTPASSSAGTAPPDRDVPAAPRPLPTRIYK